MRVVRFLTLIPVLFAAGCVHVSDSSATASPGQIRDRLSRVLHCRRLELNLDGPNHFGGPGKNDTGDFTIKVNREGQTIFFKGVYAEPTQGSFSGSMSWNRHFDTRLGFHMTRESEQTTLSSPQRAAAALPERSAAVPGLIR
jgi:hypothetical protein